MKTNSVKLEVRSVKFQFQVLVLSVAVAIAASATAHAQGMDANAVLASIENLCSTIGNNS